LDPGALGPPLFINDLYISERFFLSIGSISFVLIFFGEVIGILVFVGVTTFLFDDFGTTAFSSSSVCSRVR
jgi:hypothetical protein